MEVARTSMIHAAAPHFLWPFAVQYAAHQLNLWPRVSLPETSPTLRWTGKVGDASVFRVWGSRAFVHDTSADKLSARAIPCVFLSFPPDAPGWQFYHPTSRRVLSSQDVTFDESVPFYCLFLYLSASPPPPPLFFAPGPPRVDHLPLQGPAPSGVSHVDPLLGAMPVEISGDASAARGAAFGGGGEPGGAELEGSTPAGVETGGDELEGVEIGGAESEGAESEGDEPRGAASSGAARVGATGDTRAGGAEVTTGAGGTGGAAGAHPGGTGAAGTTGVGGAGARDPTEPGAAGAGGAGAGGNGAGGARAGGAGESGSRAGGTGAGGAGAGGAGSVDPRAGGDGAKAAGGTGAGGTLRPRSYFVPLFYCPYSSPTVSTTSGLTERREPASRPASPVRTGSRVHHPRPPPVPGTHDMALHPSCVPLRVPLLAPPESSLPAVPDPESDLGRAASPTVSYLFATVVTDPAFESTVASALDAELLEFAATCRLDYAVRMVWGWRVGGGGCVASPDPPPTRSPTAVAAAEGGGCVGTDGVVLGGGVLSLPVLRPSGVSCALGTDVLEEWQEKFECLAAAVPRFSSMLLAPEGDPDAPDIPTLCSYAEAITGTYVNAVPPSRANIVDGMWIFRVKWPPGSPPAFKAGYIARGFSKRQGVDYFQTFSPTQKITTLRAPREWHDTLRTTLAALGFTPTADPSLFLCTDTSLPPFYVLVYVNDLVFATTDTEALTLVKSELQKRHTCTDLGELRSYLGLQITRDRAWRTITLTQSHMVHHVLQHFDF
ncbi:unnamed protein product [Closterium sp. NIES-54]